MEANTPKPCPVCGVALEPGHKAGLPTWQCPDAHGVGINIVDAYGHLQRDELEAMWGEAQDAKASELLSPLTGKPMVEVTFDVDEDMTYGNDGAGSRTMTIEMDRENYFGWFSFQELKSLPTDTTGRGPAAPGLVGLQQMDEEDDTIDAVFDDLSEEDMYEDPEEEKGINGFFSGLARKLRS